MRGISSFIDATNQQSNKRSKQSAFYYATSEKLTEDLKCRITHKEHANKERVLQEQINLFLEAVVKEVNEEAQDPIVAFYAEGYVEKESQETMVTT